MCMITLFSVCFFMIFFFFISSSLLFSFLRFSLLFSSPLSSVLCLLLHVSFPSFLVSLSSLLLSPSPLFFTIVFSCFSLFRLLVSLCLFLCLLSLCVGVCVVVCRRVFLNVWCGVVCRVVWKNASVCRFKTPPCMPATRAHAFEHVRVVPAYTGTF